MVVSALSRWWGWWAAWGLFGLTLAASVPDTPFPQPVSRQFTSTPELAQAVFQRVLVDREDRVYVLTDRGVARLWGDRLGLDRSYRPLAGRIPHDLALAQGELFYLFDQEFLCNAFAGRLVASLPHGGFRRFAVGPEFTSLLVGPTNIVLFREPRFLPLEIPVSTGIERVYSGLDGFYTLAPDSIRRVRDNTLQLFHQGSGLTALAFRTNQVLVGTRNGYYGLSPVNGQRTLPVQDRLPWNEITALTVATNGIWVGTTRGVFLHAGVGIFRYFASRRWLNEDHVLDLHLDRQGNLYVLTPTGLNRIEFPRMTLAEKAGHYERKIRDRHLRYGFCAELRLRVPGDPASAEMIDTDNDGTWSSYYLASQAFRYGATRSEEARRHAWAVFETLERLQSINDLGGFPARTFERTGFKVSDPDRWRVAPDSRWEWKGHTSSDEIAAQTFAMAVLYETAALTSDERERIGSLYDALLGHIVRHQLHLVDVDGKPTLWGRWHPSYVNAYPPTVVDRRLNSAQIVAFLQFGHRVTGKDNYRDQAFALIRDHGYLQNITNSMAGIRATPGVLHEGIEMGDEWNHSDDLLAFVNYWTLYRYAFTDSLRQAYAAAIRDHWEIERIERNPIWSFILAMTGEAQFDLVGALWTLQGYPLDMVSWDIRNSHRLDLTRLPPNFRRQETASLLPPGERPLMRWNGNPFRLDGGDGGRIELAGDEFLLPYWMGRYLKIIAPPSPTP